LAVAKFWYNNKKHAVTGHTPFEPNFERHLWKENLTVQMEFLIRLQRSWEEATKLIEIAKKAMKRQFDKKRQNSQGLKVENNVWLKAKKIHSNQLSKKLDQKRYRSFKISKNIGQGVF